LRELRNPFDYQVKGLKCGTRHDSDFRTLSSNRDDLSSEPGHVRGVLKVEQDAAALDPEQMMSSAACAAFWLIGGEYIDVTVRNLEHVLTVVEELWLSSVEQEASRFRNYRLGDGILKLLGKDWVVHS